jgi:predicted dithiol-disulfide oxidoreductase (DUF899 family)
LLRNLAARQTTFVAVSRAPYDKITQYKDARGWDLLSWYSSFGSDFNYDYHVTLDASVAPIQLNYRDAPELEAAGFGWVLERPSSEQPGVSFFLRDGEEVFHTYSTYGRGTEAMGGTYSILDLTALGRQEDWEEPKGRAGDPHPAVPDFATS